MTMGRPGKGLEHVDGVEASKETKERMKAMLGTLLGSVSLQDASESVGLKPARFAELRERMLQGAADAVAPGRPGRPPVHDAEQTERLAELEREAQRLRTELLHTKLQLEIAQVAPGVLQRAQKGGSAPRLPTGRRAP